MKTKKTELLFLRLLKPGGRAAVIVPDGVLFGSSNAHQSLRKMLVEEQKLDAVISLPGGVFKPYAGVSTAILLFTKTNSGGTDHVWFYDVDADGMSLDDKRTELLPPEKLGPIPAAALTAADHAKNNLPDLLARWNSLRVGRVVPNAPSRSTNAPGTRAAQPGGLGITRPTAELMVAEDQAPYGRDRSPSGPSELDRPRTAQSFCVLKADLVAQNSDLSLNRYKQVVHAEVAHRPPAEILQALGKLEAAIMRVRKPRRGLRDKGQTRRDVSTAARADGFSVRKMGVERCGKRRAVKARNRHRRRSNSGPQIFPIPGAGAMRRTAPAAARQRGGALGW